MGKEKVVFTASIMDMCHAGHLNLLRKMQKLGTHTIVVLHDDRSCYLIKDKFPIQDLVHRRRNLELTGLADEILITTDIAPTKEFEKIIERHPDAVFVRGDDNMRPPAVEVLDEHGIEQIYIPYTKGISSTKLRDELCNS